MGAMNRRQFAISAGLAAGRPLVSSAAQRRRTPNILFLLPAQHRADWTGATPVLGVRTPNLDLIAGRGVRLTRALTASPLAAPSRACLASGREYPRCGVRGNDQDYPLEQPTLYQVLREAGYHVMTCGHLDLHKSTLDWGLDGRRFLPELGFSAGIDNAGKVDAISSGAVEARDPYMAFLHRRGFAVLHVEDYKRRTGVSAYTNTEPTPLPDEVYCDNWVANNGLDLLRAVPQGKPWFLQVNFAGPHAPFDITRRMERLCRGRQFPQPIRAGDQFPPEKHVTIRQNYTAIVENIDRLVGSFLEELRRRGELENTLIVFASDHGEMLGDHGRWGKSVPYHAAVGVPMVIAGPGVERSIVRDSLVSTIDLTATFLDYAGGLRLPSSDGHSLRQILEGKATTHREFLRSGLGPWRLVSDGRYKLVRGFDPDATRDPIRTRRRDPSTPEKSTKEPVVVLFDLKLDPQENVNFAREAPGVVERLTKLLG